MNSPLAPTSQFSRADQSARSHGLAGFGQQILNLFEAASLRAATRRQFVSATRRDLDDCGMTFADVDVGAPDLFAQDFRVAHIAVARAA